MQHPSSALSFALYQDHFAELMQAVITVPAHFVDALYNRSIKQQAQIQRTHGFAKGSTPSAYLAGQMHSYLSEHAQEFLFNYCVLGFLYDQLLQRHVLYTGTPVLSDITLKPGSEAQFVFSLHKSLPFDLHEWRNFTFKAPKRKNYKDIDRQVEQFLAQEQTLAEKYTDDGIKIHDWVNITLFLLPDDDTQEPLFVGHQENRWLRVGEEEADFPFHAVLLGKKPGAELCTSDEILQDCFSKQLETKYRFCLAINSVVPHAFFSLKDFKHFFKLKSFKEVQQKLIEVFSFRNDFSQRRATVEDALQLLRSKHEVPVTDALLEEQKQHVLALVRESPDYHVYKMQRDFNDVVHKLALKQAQDSVLLDAIAQKEKIYVDDADIHGYLNLLKRPRTKEFLYHPVPPTKMEGQEVPIQRGVLAHACRREKTINHIIYTLTRK